MNEKIIYTTENFKVCVPNKPHVSREDGGHIRIKPLYNDVDKPTSTGSFSMNFTSSL